MSSKILTQPQWEDNKLALTSQRLLSCDIPPALVFLGTGHPLPWHLPLSVTPSFPNF